MLASALALPSTAAAEPVVPEAAPAAEPAVDPLAGPRGLDPDRLVAGEEAAYRAYMRGKKAFEANDYDAALLAFGDALRQLPDESPYAKSRGALALWSALCHGQLYGLRGDATALDREAALLDAYVARLDAIARDAADKTEKQQLVEQRQAQIAAEQARIAGEHGNTDEQIDRSLRGEYEGVDASAWRPSVEDLAWVPRPDDPRPKGKQDQDEEDARQKQLQQTDERKRKPGTGLIAGGAIALGVGVAALAVMGAGMARAHAAEDFSPTQTPDERRAQIGRGIAGNDMAIAGAIAGGVAVITGAVLVGLGAKKRRAAAITPTASRRGAGLSISVRFAP
ncbi:MAG TPA: hypothetical protein VG755_31940 [Nannocystaceae bacterium]|nr:hypothetical protein [Nannocystaceae bacterium]